MSATAIEGRMRMMVARAVVSAVDDAPGAQELQIELLADEAQDAVEHFQNYGLTSHPKPEAEGLMLAVGGLRSHGIVIAVGDRRYRMRGLAEGEVALHDDQGQHVLLGRDGIVIMGKGLTCQIAGPIALNGQSITAEADMIALKTNDLRLGNGAVLAAARKTDMVSSSAITGGSTKVKIA